MRRWPFVLTFAVALVPVAAFVFIVGSVTAMSAQAIGEIGAGLFGAQFSGTGNVDNGVAYGLLAPAWGTVLMALIALVIAIPAAIALAILMEELPLGAISHALAPTLGLLSGIPPIVYALLGIVVTEFLMRPKFGGIELESEQVKAAIQSSPIFLPIRLPIGLPGNSQFLGGFLLALLIVPVVAPLVADALHGVPQELRLGSFALGAGRWHTLTRLVLPTALPGIVSATTLGALKGIGEVTIPYFVVSSAIEVVRLPQPLWDVLGHTQPLSSTGAILLRGFNTEGSGPGLHGLGLSVAYFSGLVLMVLAFTLMGVASLAQARLTRGTRR